MSVRNLKTRKTLNVPLLDGIKDPSVKDFLTKFLNEIRQTQLNIYDDLNAIQHVEKVTALPTATQAERGHLWLLDGGAGVADRLYITRKTAADTYENKEIQFV